MHRTIIPCSLLPHPLGLTGSCARPLPRDHVRAAASPARSDTSSRPVRQMNRRKDTRAQLGLEELLKRQCSPDDPYKAGDTQRFRPCTAAGGFDGRRMMNPVRRKAQRVCGVWCHVGEPCLRGLTCSYPIEAMPSCAVYVVPGQGARLAMYTQARGERP
jgi:hypothetical protein